MLQKMRFLGVPIYMNGKNYIVPSLTLRDYRANHEALNAPIPEGASILTFSDTFVPIIGVAIRRNYSDVTDEQLADWLTVETLPMAIKAVQGASGLTLVSEGE